MTDVPGFMGFAPVLLVGDDTWRWVSIGDLHVELGHDGTGHIFTIDGGTVTDFATIPWWIRWLVNPADPQTAVPAFIHDGLLAAGYEQRVAAGEFYRQLHARGYRLALRIAFYLAVVVAIDRW